MKNKLNCIMLIDDNFHDNFFHKIAINELNITDNIQVAEDGLEALAILRAENACIPELIFLDINMPKMNGWEFLDSYRELKSILKSKVIIVMLTTSDNPSDKQKAAQCKEICGYETKPLTANSLNKILQKHFPELEQVALVSH